MLRKNVMSERGMSQLLRVSYAAAESWSDASYRYENLERTAAHAIIQLTVSGACLFRAGEVRYRVDVGEAFITEVPSDTAYGYPEGETETYQLQFLALYGPLAIQLARDLREQFGPVFQMSQHPESFSLFREILERHIQHGFRDSYEESSQLYQLFASLFRESSREVIRGDAVASCYQRIQNRYREMVNVDTIAREAGISREHLTRSFNQRYGETPARMLRALRVRAAQMVINSGVEDEESVARAVGFSDVRTLRRYL